MICTATIKISLFKGNEEVNRGTLHLEVGDSLQLTARTLLNTGAGKIYVRSECNAVTVTCTAADCTGEKATVKIKAV